MSRAPRLNTALLALVTLTAVLAPSAPAAGAPIEERRPRRALWIETSANLRLLASREAIRGLVARARASGIDTLIPEAKNAWGFVIYESAIAPHIRTSPVALHDYPPPSQWYPRDFDALRALVDEAHAAGLRVHVAVNTFGEGLRLDPTSPAVGRVRERPEWESVHLRYDGAGRPRFIASSAAGDIAFVNPAHPEAQLYQLAVLWEILGRYDIDGLVLDRARYAGVDADFSDLSRARFQDFMGRTVGRWPQDILLPDDGGRRPGPLFADWVAWRASVINAYVRAAAQITRRMRPGMPVGMYVGAWYPRMFQFGQNWAHPDAPRLFPHWSAGWAQASLLSSLDYLMTGLYYRTITPWDALRRQAPYWSTVAGGAVLARRLTGGIPVLGAVWLDLYANDGATGAAAIRAAVRLTDGLMVFDLSNVEKGNWWSLLRLE